MTLQGYIELTYKPIDSSYPDYENVPAATDPAILVWHDKEAAKRDGAKCIAFYWLRDE